MLPSSRPSSQNAAAISNPCVMADKVSGRMFLKLALTLWIMAAIGVSSWINTNTGAKPNNC